jgi:hypothetical protein
MSCHVMSQCQNECRKNFSTKAATKSLENEIKFRYLDTKTTNRNYVHEEINNRLNSGINGYGSVKNL